MAVEVKQSLEQAFLINRFQRVTALYSYLDTCLRGGSPQEITQDERGNQFRSDVDDKPFSLVFTPRAVNALYLTRRSYRRQMEAQGLGGLAEEIISSYNEKPQDKAQGPQSQYQQTIQ